MLSYSDGETLYYIIYEYIKYIYETCAWTPNNDFILSCCCIHIAIASRLRYLGWQCEMLNGDKEI